MTNLIVIDGKTSGGPRRICPRKQNYILIAHIGNGCGRLLTMNVRPTPNPKPSPKPKPKR